MTPPSLPRKGEVKLGPERQHVSFEKTSLVNGKPVTRTVTKMRDKGPVKAVKSKREA